MNIKKALRVIIESGQVVCDGDLEIYYCSDEEKYIVTNYERYIKGFISKEYIVIDEAIECYLNNSKVRYVLAEG